MSFDRRTDNKLAKLCRIIGDIEKHAIEPKIKLLATDALKLAEQVRASGPATSQNQTQDSELTAFIMSKFCGVQNQNQNKNSDRQGSYNQKNGKKMNNRREQTMDSADITNVSSGVSIASASPKNAEAPQRTYKPQPIPTRPAPTPLSDAEKAAIQAENEAIVIRGKLRQNLANKEVLTDLLSQAQTLNLSYEVELIQSKLLSC